MCTALQPPYGACPCTAAKLAPLPPRAASGGPTLNVPCLAACQAHHAPSLAFVEWNCCGRAAWPAQADPVPSRPQPCPCHCSTSLHPHPLKPPQWQPGTSPHPQPCWCTERTIYQSAWDRCSPLNAMHRCSVVPTLQYCTCVPPCIRHVKCSELHTVFCSCCRQRSHHVCLHACNSCAAHAERQGGGA